MPQENPDDDHVYQLLKQVSDHFDLEDRAVRERQIRTWRRLKHYWNSLQNIYYSEVAHDWRIWGAESNSADADQGAYDKPVNVFRAYLESIIAALSITIPNVKCVPDDAENAQDIETAKAGDKIAQLVSKHNDIPLLWLHALYIIATEGMVAAHHYSKESEEYGTYKEKEYETENSEQYVCPYCNAQVPDQVMSAREANEFAPNDQDAEVMNLLLNEHEILCPQCLMQLDPALQKSPFIVTRIIGETDKPKSRQCVEAYGGLYVKIPNYAMCQKDIPYLRFSYETHYANAIEMYGARLRDKLDGSSKVGPASGGTYDPYEAWGRLSTQYLGEYPINNVTVNNYWFRPAAFNVLSGEHCDELKKKFPNGCKFVKINEYPCHASNCALDDEWTIIQNPLSDYLHYEPLGSLLTSVQDITNDLISLIIQTIEHGIPQTFADPGVLNFDDYRQVETMPGLIFPAIPKGGKSVGDAFHEVKTSTLSGEILPFSMNVQEMGQLASGALPSLFGGPAGGSKTASEYSMSRAQAQQRLQSTWKMLTFWWKNIFGKVIPAYIKDVVEDERIVGRDDSGNFINVFIRKSELSGKIGEIELESSEQLPVTWEQKKDVIMKLVELQNPAILQLLFSPENISLFKDATGIPELIIPGEVERIAEYEEIQQLVNSAPITMPPDPAMMQQAFLAGDDPNSIEPVEIPSVEIDQLLDDHSLRFAVDKNWLISDAGRLAKLENPQGYKNVLLHAQMHQQMMMQQMMQAQMATASQEQGAGNPEKPNKKQDAAPIKGEADASRFVSGQ